VQSFFDFSVCGCLYGSIGVGDHTSDMLAKATYSGVSWDFVATWNINEGQSYPYFKWVMTAPIPPAPTATPTSTATSTSTATATVTATATATVPTSTMTPVPTSSPTPTWTAVPPIQQVIQLAPISNHHFGDAPFTASAMGGASGNPVTFQTSGNCTATGTNGSKITLTSAGSCTVRAYQNGNGRYIAATPVSVTFTIARGRPTVTWSRPSNIRYGTRLNTSQLNARASISGSFRYEPATGTALPVGTNQTLRVTFTPADGTDWEQVAASTQITVLQAIPHIAIAHLANRTYSDAPVKLSVSGNVAKTTTKYSSKGACRVSGNVVTLTGAGTCTISASQPGNKDYAGVSSASVTFSIAKAKPKVSWSSTMVIKPGTALGAGQLNARATFKGYALAGKYAYSPRAGTKLPAGRQTLRVTFTPNDGKDFLPVSASTTITVRKS
jgi:hypothetical protein